MGLLDQLWDDTFAGPLPETGLSRLRKYSGFDSPIKEFGVGSGRSDGKDTSDESVRVSGSIMVVKSAGFPSPDNGSPTPSPSGATPPMSPFSGCGGGSRRILRSDAYERALILLIVCEI